MLVLMAHIEDIDDRMRWICLVINTFITFNWYDDFANVLTPPTITIFAVLWRHEYVIYC